MGDDRTLHNLVSEMSIEERNTLLATISGKYSFSKEPLYEDSPQDQVKDRSEAIEDQFTRLPWYRHLWFFILGLLKTVSPVKAFEENRIIKLGKEIDARFPGSFDYKQNLLLPLFYKALTDLKTGARFFYTALDSSVHRDKGAFYAFLVSLEMEDIHRRLQTETAPQHIIEQYPDATELELQQLALHEMEEILQTITEEQRCAMYANARSLYCLKELASFLYDRLLLAFEFEPSLQGYICSVRAVKDQLATLNDILHSFKDPPPMALIESLFVFILNEQEYDAAELQNILAQAEDSLVAIRVFNKQIPLTLILRCANRDVTLGPQVISGGEDWFMTFQGYWKEYIEGQFAEYLKRRRRQGLFESFNYFLKGKDLQYLEYAESEANPEGMPTEGFFSLSFLRTFYSVVFMTDINMVLRSILLEGDFYKREQRTAFTEYYNNLIKLEDDIKRFDYNLSPAGSYGKRYSLAHGDSSVPSKRRKIQIAIEDASTEAREIIARAKSSIEELLIILEAIIHKGSDGKYTILANMSHFIDRRTVVTGDALGKQDEPSKPAVSASKSAAFINSMLDVIQKLHKAQQSLVDIHVTELDNIHP
ncbi:MAG: DUF5312 domain-containing protein [Treponema sp.]|jgi:hypothetical protein|nr:DUF5312 domain-containing protein [Treponema sp.]